MSNKLRNTEAIQKMLQGTHKTQTRKTFGVSDAEATAERNRKREVGERWFDANGDEWEQREGFRVKNPSKGEYLMEVRKLFETPDTCPNCNNPMNKRLDKKMWGSHKMCFDCVIAMETKLRYTGQYREYERKRVRENLLAWLKDVDVEIEALKSAINAKVEFVNSDGTVEKWTAPDKKKLLKRIERDYKKLKENLLAQVEEPKNDTTT